MQKSKVTKIVYRVAAVLIIITLITSFLASGLLARYLSSNNDNDSARVAYWNIETIHKDGSKIVANQGTTHLDATDSGNNFFQVSNKSEVAAAFSSESTISLKFTADTFKSSTEISSWNFISDGSKPVTNPVQFNVYIYNCKVSELDQYLRYTKGEKTINLTEYNALSDEDKKGYKEDVVLPTDSSIKETKIMSSADNTLTVTKKVEDSVPYFYLTQKLTDGETKFTFPPNSNTYTFRVEWNVTGSADIGNSDNKSFKAYYVIEQGAYNTTTYTGLVDTNGKLQASGDAEKNNNYFSLSVKEEGVSQTKLFVLAYKECDYFEYLIYTSSLGGEPTFTDLDFVYDELETRSSGIYKTGYSKLTSAALKIISEQRTLKDVDTSDSTNTNAVTYNTLMKYREHLQAKEDKTFLDARDEFEHGLGYLSMGLSCSIIYDLKVVQVD